jgi:hypothetical protein
VCFRRAFQVLPKRWAAYTYGGFNTSEPYTSDGFNNTHIHTHIHTHTHTHTYLDALLSVVGVLVPKREGLRGH